MADLLFKAQQLCFHDQICFADLEIPTGKTTFVTGPSGAGKSTLLRLLNGVLSPTHGQLYYLGHDLETLDTIGLRKDVLLVSQAVFLFDGSIRDNFAAFYEHREKSLPSDETIKKFLSICCLPFGPDAITNTMSGGEKQRLYLAIFLSFHPAVLMLDEPTSALDSETANSVMGNIISYCHEEGITVIAVSHDKALTAKFSENILELERVENNYA